VWDTVQGKLDNIVEFLFTYPFPKLPFLSSPDPESPAVRLTLGHDFQVTAPLAHRGPSCIACPRVDLTASLSIAAPCVALTWGHRRGAVACLSRVRQPACVYRRYMLLQLAVVVDLCTRRAACHDKRAFTFTAV
jgi:hypothetical protein